MMDAKRSDGEPETPMAAVTRRIDAVVSLICRSPVALLGGVLVYTGAASVFTAHDVAGGVWSPFYNQMTLPSDATGSIVVGVLFVAIGLKLLSWAFRPFWRIFR